MLKVKKYALRDKIYGYPEACGFGDVWAVTSYLLRVSEESGRPSRFFARSQLFNDRIKLIRPFLETKGEIQFMNEPSQQILSYCEPYRIKFVPTIKRWRSTKSKIIAFQFDGHHLSDQKNMPPSRFKFLMQSLINLGYEPVDVGNHKPINFIVDTLANCRFFVGCPSGLSIVCLSVRTPIILITRALHPHFRSWLRGCHYYTSDVQMFSTVDQFLMYAERQQSLGKME